VDDETAQPQPPPEPAAPDPAVAASEFGVLLRTLTPNLWVVPAIVAANVIVFAVMCTAGLSPFSPTGDQLVSWGANFGPRTLAGEPWRLFASLFLHYGAIHLLFNMAVLWNVGLLTERMFGPLQFVVLYLAAGLCGGVASLVVHPQVASAGASGAVFGVYGALGALLWRQRSAIPAPVLEQLKRTGLTFLGYNLVYGFILPNVDVAAHVGGLLGGAAAGALLARPLVIGRPVALGRVALVAVLSLAGAASSQLLPRPADFEATFHDLEGAERRSVDEFNRLTGQLRATDPPDRQLASDIRTKVIAPWHELHARLAAPQRWSAPQQKLMDLVLLPYMDAREEVWRWEAASIAMPPGPKRIEAHLQAAQETAKAEALIEKLKSWKP
jgi:rhomboid protease GluP